MKLDTLLTWTCLVSSIYLNYIELWLTVFSDVPVIFTLYPFFHPNRSRFFNMATLYTRVVIQVIAGLLNAYPSSDLRFINTDFEGLADKSYIRWEENGGVEHQLPSFKMTNRQMLWLCFQHVASFKSHFESETLFEYKCFLRPAFREAYQCDDITQTEKLELGEYEYELFYYLANSYKNS